MAANAVFVVDPVGWNYEFRSWEGVVGRDMTRRTMKGTALALGTVPKPGTPPRFAVTRGGRPSINHSTGRLAATIHPERGRYGPELEGRVVAGTDHALFVHEGTGRHVITPHRPHGFLANRKLGFIHRGPVVHKGNRSVPFLSEHLRSMVT